MLAVILAGGLGTRLRTVVSDRPKVMAEAAGRPFLAHQIEYLAGQGVRRFVLCIGYMATHVSDHFGDGSGWGVRIDYSTERELLGTGGAVGLARHLIVPPAAAVLPALEVAGPKPGPSGEPSLPGEPFLLLNGDSYLRVDVPALVASHAGRRAADPATLGTIVTVDAADAAAYGAVEVGTGERVQTFREKGVAGPGRVNGGVYVLEPRVLDLVPPGRAVSLERETFPQILASGGHLYAFGVAGFFVDVGTPEGYRRFLAHVGEPVTPAPPVP